MQSDVALGQLRPVGQSRFPFAELQSYVQEPTMQLPVGGHGLVTEQLVPKATTASQVVLFDGTQKSSGVGSSTVVTPGRVSVKRCRPMQGPNAATL
jgi:hypothetical protein